MPSVLRSSMNSLLSIYIGAIACVLIQSNSVRAGQEVKLSIGHCPEVALSDSDADQILKEATNVVAKKDGPDDVPCDIVLKRSGSVKISPEYPSEIGSDEQFAAAKALNVNIVVVDRIRYCNGFDPRILGCAPVPGKFLVVVRNVVSDGASGPPIEGVVWAHEFGHNRGLNHVNREHALMYPAALRLNRELNQAESRTYGTAGGGLQPVMVANSDVDSSSSEPDASPSLQPIEKVVRAAYPHGLPYALLKRYPKEAAGKLREMLHSPAERPYQGQIAGALCIIGDAGDFKLIKSFIEEPPAKLSDDVTIVNKETAITSLGYLLARTNDAQVLEFLRTSLTDRGWENRRLAWLPQSDPASVRAIKNMKMAAIVALALSGTDEAKNILKLLADQKLGPGDEDPNVQAIIKQAPAEIDKVREMGLENYSRREP